MTPSYDEKTKARLANSETRYLIELWEQNDRLKYSQDFFGIVETILRERNVAIDPQKPYVSVPLKKRLATFWNGDVSLRNSIVNYFLIGQLIVSVCIGIVAYAPPLILMIFQLHDYAERFWQGAKFLVYISVFSYIIFSAIGAWKSCTKYDGKRHVALLIQAFLIIYVILSPIFVHRILITLMV
jgi:hypothetical protein